MFRRRFPTTLCRSVFAALLFAALVLLAGCMDPLSQGGHAGYAGISVLEAPGSISELQITVSGPAMSTIGPLLLSPGTTSLTLKVPTGPDRVFDISGGWFTYRRVAGVTAKGLDLSARMRPYIVVPDRNNDRLAIVKDMNGAGWTGMIAVVEDLGPPQPITAPRWVDFDNQGRLLLYFSDALVTISDPGIAGPIVDFETVTGAEIAAYDRAGGYLYYYSGTGINRWDGLGTLFFSYDGDAFGMAMGDGGHIYIVGRTEASGATVPGVEKYDPATFTVVESFSDAGVFNSPAQDVTFVNGYVYVANPNGPDGYKVLKFDTDLQLVAAFGSAPANPANPQPREFFGPRQFVATLGKRLILMDGGGQFFEDTLVNRLVAFDDVGSSSGWRTFGEHGDAENQFEFYFAC